MSEDLDCFLGNLVSYDLFKHMIDMIKTKSYSIGEVKLESETFLQIILYYDNNKIIAGMVASSTSPSVLHGADCEGHS